MNRAVVSSVFILMTALLCILLLNLFNCSDSTAPVDTTDTQYVGTATDPIIPSGKDKETALTLSSNTFTGWQRYPAEEKTWLSMTNATAYTRDVNVGGQTYVSSPSDGETWTATAIRPDGAVLNWGAITFYSQYGEDQNCFVSPYWKICNATSLYIRWYTTSQCLESGDWTMRFYNNGNLFYEGTFKVLPQIPPGKVPLMDQLIYNDKTLHHYDSACRLASDPSRFTACDAVNTDTATIKNLGCFLVGSCMILGYHGVNANPVTVNNWLKENDGYKGRAVDGDKVAYWARNVALGTVYYFGWADSSVLNDSICSRGPQLAHVRKPTKPDYHHFVTVTGQDENKTTYLINNPAGGTAGELTDKYAAEIGSIRLWGGDSTLFEDALCKVKFYFHSPGELLVTDAEGRRTGLDPLTGISYNEIPNASYYEEYIEDPDEDGVLEVKRLEISRAESGEYALTVTGTGDGTYDLYMVTNDILGEDNTIPFEDVLIAEDAVYSYTVGYDRTAGSTTTVTGGFDGTRQRPRDVNKFLSYITVSESVTTLAPGTESFGLHIVYADAVYPETFAATLNGNDISDLFAPVAGGNELVNIPLSAGSNVLQLSIDGQTPDRVMTDTDLLELIVP